MVYDTTGSNVAQWTAVSQNWREAQYRRYGRKGSAPLVPRPIEDGIGPGRSWPRAAALLVPNLHPCVAQESPAVQPEWLEQPRQEIASADPPAWRRVHHSPRASVPRRGQTMRAF